MKKKKVKGFLFLTGLVFYCTALIFVSKGFSDDIDERGGEALAESIGVIENLQYFPIEGIEEIEQIEFENNSEVLGVGGWKAEGSCQRFDGIREVQLFCQESNIVDSYTIGVGEGDDVIIVSEDVEIEFRKIYAPAALFAGSRAPADNLVQINNHEGKLSFRNANEIVNPEFEYLNRMPPLDGYMGDEISREDGTSERDVETFFMHGKPSGAVVEVVNDIVFDVDIQREQSVCPEVVNDGRFNVLKSNDMGKDLVESITPPGIMDFSEKRENAEFCNETPKRVINLGKEHSFPLCQASLGQEFKHFVKGIFTDSNISSTPIYDDDGNLVGFSKGVEFAGILIDAPFGSADECNEDYCAIRHLEAGRLISTPPIMTDDLYPNFMTDEEKEEDYIVSDPIFLTTPCEVWLDSKAHETKCYWDLSAWQHLFHLEQIFTYPGFENAYTEDEYWDDVEAELTSMPYTQTSPTPSNGANGTNGNSNANVQEFPNNAWTEHLLKKIRESGLMDLNPRDASEFFPGGVVTERGWANLLMMMSYYESGHNPETEFLERNMSRNQRGEIIVSTGLFQLSYESVAGYGYNVNTEQLKDPFLNIEIAVAIMERWVRTDNIISGGSSAGASRYWAVLRPPKVNDIKSALK